MVGVVFNPLLNELFTATKGGGAFLNGQRIHVASADRLDKAVIATNVRAEMSLLFGACLFFVPRLA